VTLVRFTSTLLLQNADTARIDMQIAATGEYVAYKGHIDMVRLLRKALVAAKPYIKEHGTQTGWTQGVIDDIRQIDAAIDAATIEES
jgi:hypothetical protein